MPPTLVAPRHSPSATLFATLLFILAPGSGLAQTALPAPNESGELAKVESPSPPHFAGEEQIRRKYIQEGGAPGASYIEQKAFLKAKGLIDPDDVGFVKIFQGEVTFARNRKSETIKVTGTQPVLFLDFDETGFDSQIEMQFDDGSIITMGENTGLKIDEMIYDPKTGERKVFFSLPVGTIRIKASKNLNPNSVFEIRTPLLVTGLRGTELIIQVDETGRTRVTTLEGAVAVRRHRPGEPRPAPKLGSADLSALGAAANEVMVVAGMMTEALPGRGDALRTRIARVDEIRTAVRATVIKQTPTGLEKKDEKSLPPGFAKKKTPRESPAGLAQNDAGNEAPPGLAKEKRANQAPQPFNENARSQGRAGAANGLVTPNPQKSAKGSAHRGAVPAALTDMTRFRAQRLSNETADGNRRAVSRMAGQETKSLAKETAGETVKALVQTAAKEMGKAISRIAIQESVAGAVKETAVRSVKEQATASAKEQAVSIVRQAAQEAATTTAKQAATQAVQESAKQAAQEAASTTAKQAATQAVQESAKQAAQEAASTTAKQTATQAVQESAKQAAQEAASTTAKQAATQAVQESAKQAAQESAKQAAQEAAAAAAKEQINNTAQETANNIVKETKEKAAKENSSNAATNQSKGKSK